LKKDDSYKLENLNRRGGHVRDYESGDSTNVVFNYIDDESDDEKNEIKKGKWQRKCLRQLLSFRIILLCILSIFSLFGILFCLIYLPIDSSNSVHTKSSSVTKNWPKAINERLSRIECRSNSRSCFISNLYIIHGQLHLYVGSKGFMHYESNEWSDIVMYTGIGFGSPVVRLYKNESYNNSNNGSLKDFPRNGQWIPIPNNSKDNSSSGNNNTKVLTYPLFLHYSNPPSLNELPIGFMYHLEPLMIFSLLWENLFRTIYAGVGAWYSLNEYRMLFEDKIRFVLIDPDKPSKFISVLQAVTSYPIIWFEQLEDGLYKGAVIGISRDVLVAETNLETHHEWRFERRSLIFRRFCGKLKQHFLGRLNTKYTGFREVEKEEEEEDSRSNESDIPRVTFIQRDVGTRRILNQPKLVFEIQTLPINLTVYSFGNISLPHQIAIIDKTDIFMAMHGAALTHLLFLNPESYVIELFPFGFRKMIYQNLARIMKVKYVYWQNLDESQTVFHWDYVEKNRFTNTSKEEIIHAPLNWYNMDSKNYWRNQDTNVSLSQVKHVMTSILKDRDEGDQYKFLMFLPWEQLNNQILGFKSACATAFFLNRTLVLPHLGYRIIRWRDGSYLKEFKDDDHFTIHHFKWKPFERYFDLDSLENLPCSWITFQNFYSLNQGQELQRIHFHELGKAATEQQLKEYYRDIAMLTFREIEYDPNLYYGLSKEEILVRHQHDPNRVLALGSMFMFYHFNHPLKYPIRSFQNLLNDSLYYDITQSLSFISKLNGLSKQLLHWIPKKFIAIHVRRGDYSHKCEPFQNDISLYQSCATPIDHMVNIITSIYSQNEFSSLYISTNEDSSSSLIWINELRQMGYWKYVFSQSDLLNLNKNSTLSVQQQLFQSKYWNLDTNDLAMLDEAICIQADGFIGNMHSSFSRYIIEKRILEGLSWHVF